MILGRATAWAGRATPRPGRLAALAAGLRGDVGRVPLAGLVARSLRRARVLLASGGFATLAMSDCFAAHLAARGERDPLFFLAQRHYLARGLPPGDRLAAAVAHYRHEETAFAPAYGAQVYRQGGLTLWQSGDGAYRISLEPGLDVLHEGGASVVLRAGAQRLCVLSYAVVPRHVVDPQGRRPDLPALVHFVTRKQLTSDRSYQPAFHAAFDRVTAGHMAFAALEGLILAEGGRCAVGIAPAAHPVASPALAPILATAYADFWATLGAEPLSDRGTLIALPVALAPVDRMDPSRRKRALERRAHLAEVRAAAVAALAPYLAGKA